jgi:hypothetical protein
LPKKKGRPSKNKGLLVPVREPNGRLSRATCRELDARSPAEIRRLRDAAIAGMRDPEWATEIGRLFLDGRLEAALFEAGKRWARLSVACRQAIAAPRQFPAVSAFVEKRGGHDADPDSDEGRKQAARDRIVVAEFLEAHAVLKGAGVLAESVVRHVCEDNKAIVGQGQMVALTSGLSWLAQHWGLTAPSKHVRKAKS